MRGSVVALVLLFVAIADSQPWYDAYLLKAPVVFRGQVVDDKGQHLAGVRVYGVERNEDFPLFVELGQDGQFDFRTRAPRVVFRRSGYQSEFFQVANRRNIRVALKAIGEPASMPVCSAHTDCVSNGAFCLPRVDRIKFGKVYQGIDASVREAKAPKISGSKTILTHGMGPSWVGEPSPQHVWESVEYSESYQRIQELLVIDARGKDNGGLMWRSIGLDYERRAGGDAFHVGERVDYGSRSPDEAAFLDRVIDGICVTRPER